MVDYISIKVRSQKSIIYIWDQVKFVKGLKKKFEVILSA